MDDVLNTREDCIREIRELVGDDLWAARFVLLAALERLDLAGVNWALTQALAAAERDVEAPMTRLERLAIERWGSVGRP